MAEKNGLPYNLSNALVASTYICCIKMEDPMDSCFVA
jgi:hypothetical protein